MKYKKGKVVVAPARAAVQIEPRRTSPGCLSCHANDRQLDEIERVTRRSVDELDEDVVRWEIRALYEPSDHCLTCRLQKGPIERIARALRTSSFGDHEVGEIRAGLKETGHA